MDILDEELVKFWEVLNENGVRYIMVGGFATRFHGFNRSTDDLDMWLEDTIENRKHLRRAFSQLGYGDFASLETMQFVPGWTNFFIGSGIELDIMTQIENFYVQVDLSLPRVGISALSHRPPPGRVSNLRRHR